MGLIKSLRRILRRQEGQGYKPQQITEEVHNALVTSKEFLQAKGVPRDRRRWLKRRVNALTKILQERERLA